MQLIQSWKDSLKFFKPQNFRLFGLVSLNTMIKTLGVWLRLFWPLFVISFAVNLDLVFGFLPIPTSFILYLSMISNFLLFVTLFLSLRPSVKKKTYAYFLDYKLHIGICAIPLFAISFLLRFFSGFGAGYKFMSLLFTPSLVIYITILFLFYFDTRGSIIDFLWSVVRSIKMIWYGLPFFIILLWGLKVLFFVIVFFIFMSGFVGKLLLMSLLMLLSVIPASFAANFYTKRLHDQYKEYFN